MSMTFEDRNQRVQNLIEACVRIRRAGELIKHSGYSPHAGDEQLPEGEHSIFSALLAVCDGDRNAADDLMCRVAGFLLMAAREEVTARPMNGDVVNVVSYWEGALNHPTKSQVFMLLSATAQAVDAHASVVAVDHG
jgi:hypothetical protein